MFVMGVFEMNLGNLPFGGGDWSGESMSWKRIFWELLLSFVTSKVGSPVASKVEFSNKDNVAKD